MSVVYIWGCKSQMTLMHFICFISLISNAETFFTTLDHFTATLMSMNLARQIHQEFLKQKGWSTTHTQKTVPLTKTQLDGFQYLCGYVVKNLIKKT